MLSIPASNTVIYAITGLKLFTEPNPLSEQVLFATDVKNKYNPWITKQQVGSTTGNSVKTSTGTWIEVTTRRWKKRAFDSVRVNINAWFRLEDQLFYTETESNVIEQKTLDERLAEAYDTLEPQYKAVDVYTNREGITMLTFGNGYKVSIEDYEKLSLVEKKNLAKKAEPIVSQIVPNTTNTNVKSATIPTWAKALLVVVGVTGIGIGFYQLFKKR
ncbi:hypothetical protein FHS57_004776 [Runella defluvii]|uniref:Uncharacterized protein n=1 Tax=Runella defluvii TaxID=370973 RepID=A0A7W5ZPV6_9BACT|nr:hypothetical protein [Runella defluvii]MBB3840756.1 hypothetical protein [Runella defluvii]